MVKLRALLLLTFVAIWFAVAATLCVQLSKSFLPIVVLTGITLYGVGAIVLRRHKSQPTQRTLFSTVLKHIGAIAIIFIAALLAEALCVLVYLTTPFKVDVLGANGSHSSCQITNISRVKDRRSDNVAIVRLVSCPGMLAQGEAYYVVFVHSALNANSLQNIALQYAPGFQNNELSPAPTAIWDDRSHLMIVAPGILEHMVLKKTSIDGISITYKLGHVWPDSASHRSL